jgi:aminoglycoside phosphotransferase family enzyme
VAEEHRTDRLMSARANCSDEDLPVCATEPSLLQKVAALRSLACYPDDEHPIEAIETHFAWVFLTRHYAYKLKKPIRYDQLELTTLAARRTNCEREVQLNRRLAPHVYLGVVPLTVQHDQRIALGGHGSIVDWLVWMHRLPDDRMLARAMLDGTVPPHSLQLLGERLALFYADQPPVPLTAADYVSRIQRQMSSDLHELAAPDLRLPTALLAEAEAMQQAAFAGVRTELGERAREHRIVDAHGDLRPEHICLGPPLCVIDSLEFADDLRTMDAAEELAFLSLECAIVRRPIVAEAVIDAYKHSRGDNVSQRLMSFYRSRRATVRAKLMAWHCRDPDYLYADRSQQRTLSYLDFAIADARSSTQ